MQWPRLRSSTPGSPPDSGNGTGGEPGAKARLLRAGDRTHRAEGQMRDAEDQMALAEDQMADARGQLGGASQAAEDQMADAEEQIAQAEERMQETVAEAAALAEETGSLGLPGKPVNRRSPFFIGMAAAAGVAVTYALAELTIRARSVLILIGLAMFIAAGLEPMVSWLTRRRVPRWAAVITVLLACAGVIAAFIASAIPPLAAQATELTHQLPHYLHALQDHNSQLGKLNVRFHLQKRLTSLITSRGSDLIGGVLGAGESCSARQHRCSWWRC